MASIALPLLFFAVRLAIYLFFDPIPFMPRGKLDLNEQKQSNRKKEE